MDMSYAEKTLHEIFSDHWITADLKHAVLMATARLNPATDQYEQRPLAPAMGEITTDVVHVHDGLRVRLETTVGEVPVGAGIDLPLPYSDDRRGFVERLKKVLFKFREEVVTEAKRQVAESIDSEVEACMEAAGWL